MDENLFYREICILPDVLVHYRIHSGQVSKAHRDLQNKCAQEIQKKLLEQLLRQCDRRRSIFSFYPFFKLWI